MKPPRTIRPVYVTDGEKRRADGGSSACANYCRYFLLGEQRPSDVKAVTEQSCLSANAALETGRDWLSIKQQPEFQEHQHQ